MELPQQGRAEDELFDRMSDLKEEDASWREGRTWSLVYHVDRDVERVRNRAYEMFSSLNALNPLAFNSILTFERDVVAMTADLLQGDDEVVGNLTSGGTESILLAVYTARERLREKRPEVDRPELVLPETAHPAWAKAAHYFDLEVKRLPVRADWRADPSELPERVGERTALVVASAPSYPHGVIDPVEALAGHAAERDVPLHVDACIGGFVLPFLREQDPDLPAFDFSVPGVTSISADPHKYGYTAKGTSVLLHRNRKLRRHQLYYYDEWPGGIYAAPNLQGTRPGGPMAAAWAVMQYLGKGGYRTITERVMAATESLMDGVREIDGLRIVSDPDMCIFAIESTDPDVDVWKVEEFMGEQGWELERQQNPPSVHLSVMHHHADVVEEFLRDLKEAVDRARAAEASEPTAPLYGLSAFMDDDEEDLRDVVLDMMNDLFA